MPDQTGAEPGNTPGPADFLNQLGAMSSRLWGFPGQSDALSGPTALPSLPQMGSLSAAQFKAMTTAVLAQRKSIEALQTQLQAFDEHLAALQAILEPLLEWSKNWAALETKATLRPDV
jgi:hypothetical protein